jgi:hypothetical protein
MYKCSDEKCGHLFDELVQYEYRDEVQDCPECQSDAPRTWEQCFPQVSTEKTSESIPGVAARGRFDKLREKQSLKKEKAAARQSGDRATEKKINKEMKKL